MWHVRIQGICELNSGSGSIRKAVLFYTGRNNAIAGNIPNWQLKTRSRKCNGPHNMASGMNVELLPSKPLGNDKQQIREINSIIRVFRWNTSPN
jgi:hypothetical protein